MIKFFRRIRHQLISENKFSKYLLYATGEILLVVIGILIALSINNWNDQKKGRLKKNILLKALDAEFKQNLSQLDSVLKFDNLVVESSFEFLKLNQNDTVLTDMDYMGLLLQNTSWNWTFDPRNGALLSGISSGEINLIDNDSLTNILFSWQDVVLDARENEERALTTRLEGDRVIERHIRNVEYRSKDRKELGNSKFQSDYKKLVSDPLFEDYISNRYSRMLDAVVELNTVRYLNLKIIELIEEEQRRIRYLEN